jgi:hypothetical protein
MAHHTFIILFHLKMNVHQNVKLPHIVWSLPQKHFLAQIYSNIISYKIKKCCFFRIQIFLVLPYYM